jgi:hypothetical protein
MPIIRRRHDDDDMFDEKGVLRDGCRYRVPMYALDTVQREMQRQFGPLRFSDVDGQLHEPNPVRHQPGFVRCDTAARDAKEAAYREVAERDCNAWRAPAPHRETAQNRWDGSDREIPVAHITGDARTDAYLARAQYDENAWRSNHEKER